MSELSELITQLCPDGVPYKELNEISEMKRGTSVTKKDVTEGNIPVISGGREPAYYCDTYNRDGETITVAGSGAGAGYVQYWTTPIFVCDAFSIKGRDCILTKYLYYCLANMQEYIYSTKKGSGVPHVHISSIENVKIPVPPLPVQSEIVQILDNFTESSAKLIADLERERWLRKKQYLEYSHALFTQSDCVKRTTLGEIVDICMCKRIMKVQTDATGDVPFYQNGTLGGEAKLYISNELFHEYSQKYKFPNQGDVMLSTVGTVGKTIQYDGKPAYFQDSNIVWLKRKNEDVTNEYLYWFCVSMPWKLPERATLKHLHNYMIAETEIAIPSKERQAYVISKFQELESAFKLIDAALIAETEARQKQYEYYRNKLLTFSNSQ